MPPALARPAAVLTAALLVAGVLQTAPAAADTGDPTGPSLSVAVLLPGGSPGGPGSSPDLPARLHTDPGATTLRILVTNTGSEALIGVAVTDLVVTNGTLTQPDCDFGGSATGATDGATLDPGAGVACTASLSAVAAGTTNEDVVSVSATSAGTAIPVTADAHLYATAEDDGVRLGDRVWRDSNRNGVQDPAEPGIAGVQLTLAGPTGPVTDLNGDVVGARTTAADGSYTFTDLPAQGLGEQYTVTVVGGSAALRGLEATRAGVGDPASDSSTGSATSGDGLGWGDEDDTLDFGYVTPPPPPVTPPVTPPAPSRAHVRLTVDAPARAVKGTRITVKGSIERAGKAYRATTLLQRNEGHGWTRVASVRSSSKGALATTTTATRTGSYRYHFAGNRTTDAGDSRGDRVSVRLAAVRLTVDAPGSVTKGRTITVRGSVKREGRPFRTTAALEFRSGGAWSRLKTVRSSSTGALSTSVRPSRSGDFRYRFAGNSTTATATSRADHVVVKAKPKPKPKPSGPAPRAYGGCRNLNAVYPHGVGRSGAKDHTRSGKNPVTDFVRDTRTYNLNSGSDGDHDGIACEKH